MNCAPPNCSRSTLVKLLHLATELEHTLCCQYLYAVFSLRRLSTDFSEKCDSERVELMMNATGRWASDICVPGLSQFVTTRGGLYCFLPSITALKWMAANAGSNPPWTNPNRANLARRGAV